MSINAHRQFKLLGIPTLLVGASLVHVPMPGSASVSLIELVFYKSEPTVAASTPKPDEADNKAEWDKLYAREVALSHRLGDNRR